MPTVDEPLSGTPTEVVAAFAELPSDQLRAALLARTRPERQRIAELFLDSVDTWQVIRELVLVGELDRPANPDYLLTWHRWAFRKGPTAELLFTEPGALDEIWELLAIEGGGETSFAAHDKYASPGETWAEGLRVLAGRGVLDRQRLLDLTLDVLGRDFGAFRAQWYSAFHDSLEPTVDERTARQHRYARLANSTVPATVSFAVRALSTVDKSGPLDDDVVLPHLVAAAANRTAGTVKLAMRLAGAIHRRRGDLTATVLAVYDTARQHQNSDVRAIADRALTELGSAPAAEPVVRVTSREYPEPTDPRLLERSVLAGRPELAIPGTPAALAELLAAAIEDSADADRVEAVLSGVAVHAASGELRAAVAPLVRRARRRAEDWGGTVLELLVELTLRLAGEEVPERKLGADWLSPIRSRTRASSEVANATHTGGWIDPRVLVRRLATEPEPPELQLVSALLRLAPDHRAEALSLGGGLAGLSGAAVRFALGGERPDTLPPRIGVAAAKARQPDACDPVAVLRGKDTEAVRWSASIVTDRRGDEVLRGSSEPPLIWPDLPGLGTLFKPDQRAPELIPHRLLAAPFDVPYEELSVATSWHTRWAETPTAHDLAVLRPYLDVPSAPGPSGRIMIATALHSGFAVLNQLAVDVVLSLLDRELIGPRALGDAFGILGRTLVLTRVATVLTAIANDHPAAVLTLLDTLLPQLDPGQRGLFAVLELAADLTDRGAGGTGSATATWLAGVTGSGKAAKAASRLR